MHYTDTENKYPGMTFEQLVSQWQPVHWLKLETTTCQTYEKRLPLLVDYLKDFKVEDISIVTIDNLISHWTTSPIFVWERDDFTGSSHRGG